MRSGILRTYVATLRLRRDAPFPSQIARRQRYRMKLLPAAGKSAPCRIPSP